MRFSARATALAATASLALSGCAGGSGANAGSATLDIASLTMVQSLDPKDATGSALPYFQAVYDTLIQRAPDGSLKPMSPRSGSTTRPAPASRSPSATG